MDGQNVAVVDNAIAEILTNPEEHDQEYWGHRSACGTKMCLAGHIVTQAGWKLLFPKPIPGIVNTTSRCSRDGCIEDIEAQACREAELDAYEAERLFYSWGGPEDLARVWKEIKEEHGL